MKAPILSAVKGIVTEATADDFFLLSFENMFTASVFGRDQAGIQKASTPREYCIYNTNQPQTTPALLAGSWGLTSRTKIFIDQGCWLCPHDNSRSSWFFLLLASTHDLFFI